MPTISIWPGTISLGDQQPTNGIVWAWYVELPHEPGKDEITLLLDVSNAEAPSRGTDAENYGSQILVEGKLANYVPENAGAGWESKRIPISPGLFKQGGNIIEIRTGVRPPRFEDYDDVTIRNVQLEY
jgi:hypothetical protein